MGWLFHRKYVGPDRRGGRFQIRFFERRGLHGDGGESPKSALRALFERGVKWIDAATYFGPDRRSGAFSHFILERRRHHAAGNPPPLHIALRQLRVRVLEAETAEGRSALRERLTATAMLAYAHGNSAIGDHLTGLARRLEDAGEDFAARLQSELIAAEALLHDASEH